METKHTQGKWVIAPNRLVVIKLGTNDIIADCDTTDVKTSISQEEAEANAKLIASAPEMLEMLIKLRRWAISKGIDIDGKLIIDTDLIIKQATE